MLAKNASLQPPKIFEMLTTVTSSTATPTASKATEVKTSLGSLGTLPRELRDKIYSYLFSGFYKAIYPSTWLLLDIGDRNMLKNLKESGRDLTMLRLSKAIGHEAVKVLYSEGVFLCSLIFHDKFLCLPQGSIDRMMKIEIDVYTRVDAINAGWEITIQKLSVTGTIRKSIHVKFHGSISMILKELPGKVSDGLRSLTGYRTVIVEFSVVNYYNPGGSESHLNIAGDDFDLVSFIAAGMRNLESTLGPATLSHTSGPAEYAYNGIPGYASHAICSQFHPSQHGAMVSDT